MKLVGIIGDPVGHSLSPRMHNAAFRKMGLNFLYVPFHITPKGLASFVRQATRWQMAGFNVTIPHKERILSHLDWISPKARTIGAVNTVEIRNGRLEGHNTDADGYRLSLQKDLGFHLARKTAVVFGAGGAARAVVFALARAGARKITILNRTPDKARRLATEFSRLFPKVVWASAPLRPMEMRKCFPAADLVVNTTSVGLQGSRFSKIPWKALPRKAIVSDLVYRPRMTPLLKDARKKGLRTHTGEGMLLHQGALAFRLWTGKTPDVSVMKQAIETSRLAS